MKKGKKMLDGLVLRSAQSRDFKIRHHNWQIMSTTLDHRRQEWVKWNWI